MQKIGCWSLSAVLLVSFLLGCAPTGIKIMPVPVDRSLEEMELLRDPGLAWDKLVLIDVDGIIMNSRPNSLLSDGEHPVSLLTEKLEAARMDSAVKGVILRINSPGGSVTASEIMHSEIKRFQRSGKPVVAIMMDVAASGGYYMACACDEIIAHPTTVTGSIGVIMQTVNLAGTLAKLGIETDAIKSGPRKDAGSPFRSLSPEERQIFQDMIDEMYQRFVDVVAEGRSDLSRQQVLELADGRVYTAKQALELGMIDRLGTLRQAIERTKEHAAVKRCRIVTYQRPFSWHPNIYAKSPSETPAEKPIRLIDLDLPSWFKPGGAKFMYLWTPSF